MRLDDRTAYTMRGFRFAPYGTRAGVTATPYVNVVHGSTPLRLIARLEHGEAEGARRFGEFKAALAAAERALLRYREVGDGLEIARTQSPAGVSLVILGRAAEAAPSLREALEGGACARQSRVDRFRFDPVGNQPDGG